MQKIYSYIKNNLYVFLQTLSMAELRQHHDPSKRRKRSIERMHAQYGSCLEEDRRLPMFGWTIEALNMLVLPMIRDK